MTPLLILGLDTSSAAVCVALVELAAGDPPTVRRQARREVLDARRHGELLSPGIAAVLAELGARPAEVGAVAVGLGPGPYTGLRVGIVTAASFAAALGVPAYGVCSLDAIAADDLDGAGPAERLVVTDARRREVYWARYDAAGTRVGGPGVDRPAQLASRLAGWTGRVLGEGARLYGPAFVDHHVTGPRYPAAGAVVRLAAARALAGEPGGPLNPLYLRRPDAAPPGAPKRATPRDAA